MKLETITLSGLSQAQTLMTVLGNRSQYFTFTPLPDDCYEIGYKPENRCSVERAMSEINPSHEQIHSNLVLDKKTSAGILAALRFSQENHERFVNMPHHDEITSPLSKSEIDELCDEINATHSLCLYSGDIHVVVVGNPFDGLEFYGPFSDYEDSSSWAENQIRDKDWWSVRINAIKGTVPMKTETTEESYKAIALCTSHLTKQDIQILEEEARDPEEWMVMERGPGFFIKLYEDLEPNLRHGHSESIKSILNYAHSAGYRMIEFDRDACEIPGFPIYEN